MGLNLANSTCPHCCGCGADGSTIQPGDLRPMSLAHPKHSFIALFYTQLLFCLLIFSPTCLIFPCIPIPSIMFRCHDVFSLQCGLAFCVWFQLGAQSWSLSGCPMCQQHLLWAVSPAPHMHITVHNWFSPLSLERWRRWMFIIPTACQALFFVLIFSKFNLIKLVEVDSIIFIAQKEKLRLSSPNQHS